jgi:hypothetical protein
VINHEDPRGSTYRNYRDRRPVVIQNGIVLHHRPVGQTHGSERDIALAQQLPGPESSASRPPVRDRSGVYLPLKLHVEVDPFDHGFDRPDQHLQVP